MSVFFVDSSALAKRYVAETGSAWLKASSDPSSGNTCVVLTVTSVELLAALYRRVRIGSLSLHDAQQAEALFRGELQNLFLTVTLTPAILDHAMRLVRAHPLKAYDAIQLASALLLHAQRTAAQLPALTFLSADATLNRAAQAEGLLVDDPNQHP